MSDNVDSVRTIQGKRWILILGFAFLTGLVFIWLPSLAEPQQALPRWETVLAEDFSEPLSSSWTLIDASDTDGGEYYWGAETYTYTSPLTGLWSVGGGADGSALTAGVSAYGDNVDAWAIYGPMDVGSVFDGEFTFNWWLDTASESASGPESYQLLEAVSAPERGDWLGWCVMTDLDNMDDCQGVYVSGSSSQWFSGTLSLKPYIKASQALSGSHNIWIAFHFVSDDDGRVGRGAFLDDVLVRLNYGYGIYLPLLNKEPSPTPTNTPTPSPTPTPSEYYDSFDNSGSGWPNDDGVIYDEGGWDVHWRRGYVSSDYRIKIDEGPAPWVWFYQPDALAPYRPPSNVYCVETAVRFEAHAWWANAGLIFGANEANTDLYALCLGVGDNRLGWHITRNDEYAFPKVGCAYQGGVIAIGDEGTRWGDWNRLQVSVNGDWITAYVSGVNIGNYRMPGLAGTTRVGLVGGDYEVTPVDIRFSYFRVIPNQACVPRP